MDFTIRWSKLSEIAIGRIISWLGISESKYHDWRQQYGKANHHNHQYVPRRFWLTEAEIERWHKSLKGEWVRPGTPLSREDARRLVDRFVKHYNDERLHGTID